MNMSFGTMKKGYYIFIFFCSFQINAFAQLGNEQSNDVNGFVDGWYFARTVKAKLVDIKSSLEFKSFTLSTQNAKDDIYNLLTNQLVERANVFTITNSFEIASIGKFNGSGNDLNLQIQVREFLGGAGESICYGRGEYLIETNIKFRFSADFQNNRVSIKPSYNLSNFSADACFYPGEKYTSSVSSFKKDYKRYIQEIENYYIRQFETVVTYNSDTFNPNDSNFEETFWKALTFESGGYYGYTEDDLDRDIKNFRNNQAEKRRLANIKKQEEERERSRKAQEKQENEAKLTYLYNEVAATVELNNPSITLKALIAYRDHKKMMGYSTQFNDEKIIELKDQIKSDFEQFLTEGKSNLKNKKTNQALDFFQKAKELRDRNADTDIYFDGDYEINYLIQKAEKELAADQNALQESTELVVDDNLNLAYEKQTLVRAISLQSENVSFKQKLEQVNLRLKVVPLLKEGDELLEEDKISEAIKVYRSALVIMPNLDVTAIKLQSAQEALSAKSRSKHQLLEEIQTELKDTDGFDDVAKEKARQKVLDYIKDFPDDVELMVTATDLFIKESLGLEDAYTMTQAVLKIDAENVANLNNLGEIFYLNNQTEESMSAFQQAWNLGDKDNPNTLKRLTQGNYTLYLRTKEIGYAQNALKAALYAQNLSLDDPVFSRVTTNLCNTNENLPCNE